MESLVKNIITITVFLLLFTHLAFADEISQSKQILERVNAKAIDSQTAIDKIARETESHVTEYRNIIKKTESINQYNQQLQVLIESQATEISSLESQMLKLDDTRREIGPLMNNMLEGLALFVSLDMPFLLSERNDRIKDLKQMMNRADVSLPEKYRRILASFMIEVDYGNTIESYSQTLPIEGEDLNVDMLRVGRLALLYQTRDEKRQGFWDSENKEWKALPKEYQQFIKQGLKVAKKQIAPDLLTIPVKLVGDKS